jgi:hypothetical protein
MPSLHGRTITEYARGTIHHWVTLASGTFLVVAYQTAGVVLPGHEHWWNKTMPPWLKWLLIACSVILAQFLAWRDMRLERDALRVELNRLQADTPLLWGQQNTLARSARMLEVVVKRHNKLDSVFLEPALSSDDPAKPHDVFVPIYSAEAPARPTKPFDLTILTSHLRDIEVINHDDKPTEIQRLWLGIIDPKTENEVVPREIKKEKLSGTLRIEARSRRRYSLDFTAVFQETISQQDAPQRVVLCLKAIGFSERQIRLEEVFFPRPLV